MCMYQLQSTCTSRWTSSFTEYIAVPRNQLLQFANAYTTEKVPKIPSKISYSYQNITRGNVSQISQLGQSRLPGNLLLEFRSQHTSETEKRREGGGYPCDMAEVPENVPLISRSPNYDWVPWFRPKQERGKNTPGTHMLHGFLYVGLYCNS